MTKQTSADKGVKTAQLKGDEAAKTGTFGEEAAAKATTAAVQKEQDKPRNQFVNVLISF